MGSRRSRSAELCRSLPPPTTTDRCRPPSPRRLFDETLKPEIARIQKENLDVYGADIRSSHIGAAGPPTTSGMHSGQVRLGHKPRHTIARAALVETAPLGKDADAP